VRRESPKLSPNRAIILIGLVVENPLGFEDGPYFPGKVLRLQSSLTIICFEQVLVSYLRFLGMVPVFLFGVVQLIALLCR